MAQAPATPFQWPSARHLGAEPVRMDEATKTVEIAFTPPSGFANMRGVVQGGLLAGFMDEAMGAAVYMGTGGKLQLSLDLSIAFLAPVTMERITVKARPVKAGKRVCFVEAELFDSKGTLCATGRATTMAIEWPGEKAQANG